MGNDAVCSFCSETDKCEQRVDKNDFTIINKKTSPKNSDIIDSEISQPRFSSQEKKISSFIFENFGIIKWENNSIYKGYFKKEIPNGWGIFTHPKNGIFQGEYINDQPNGYGIYKHISESLYEGYWENEKQNGIGIEKWPDGAIYFGEFIQGKKNGIGKYIFPNKNVYYGQWEQNLMNGFGIYKYGKEEIYCGEWLNGLRDGYGEVYGTNNNYFFGFFRNNIQNGFFLFYNNVSGKIIIGFNYNGKIDGVAKVFKPNCEGKFLIVKNGHKLKEIQSAEEFEKIKEDGNYTTNIMDFEKKFNKFFLMKRSEVEQILIEKIYRHDNEDCARFLNNKVLI